MKHLESADLLGQGRWIYMFIYIYHVIGLGVRLINYPHILAIKHKYKQLAAPQRLHHLMEAV